MSNEVRHNNKAAVVKGGWLRKNILSLLVICLVVAMVVGLFIYSHCYPERIAEFENYGYLGAFVIALITNATIILPFPGIVLLFALGAAFNPIFIGLASGIGGTIGEMSCYLLGYTGRGVVQNRRMYDRAVGWLERWGVLTIFVFAITHLPFDILGIAAGFLRYTFWKFFIACWLGKTLLYIGMAFAGAWGWEAFISGDYLTSPVALSVLTVVGVLVLLLLALWIENWTWKKGR